MNKLIIFFGLVLASMIFYLLPIGENRLLVEHSFADGRIGSKNIIQNNSLLPIVAPPQKFIIYNTLIEEVIECESGWDNSARGLAGEIGLCQFMPATWEYFNELRGTDLDIYNEDHQLEMIDYAFKNNLENHWTCYRLLNK